MNVPHKQDVVPSTVNLVLIQHIAPYVKKGLHLLHLQDEMIGELVKILTFQ